MDASGTGDATGDTWIFAYGSLLWDPGFDPAERVPARLEGYGRGFCMWSVRWRGTEEDPGLVLALDACEGAACDGLALRLPTEAAEPVLAGLRARELVSDAYEERVLPLALADGRRVAALAYVIRRDHRQYARVAPEEQAAIIARARGARGPNRDYLARTVEALRAMGISDEGIEALHLRVSTLGETP